MTDEISQNIPNQPHVNASTQSFIWTKAILRTNNIFLILSLLFVFGVDLFILVGSAFSLLVFWIEMLGVLAIFLIFYYLEKNIFSKKFAANNMPLDKIIFTIIILRNIIIFLNFIPFVQLAGISIGVYAAIPFILIYALCIWVRYNQYKKLGLIR